MPGKYGQKPYAGLENGLEENAKKKKKRIHGSYIGKKQYKKQLEQADDWRKHKK